MLLRHWVRLEIAPDAKHCQHAIALDANGSGWHDGAMTLKQYLALRGNTGLALAQRMGVSSTTISRWASGKQFPAVDALRLLYTATNGKVKPNDFLEK